MKTVRTYRKYTVEQIIQAYLDRPQSTAGGNPVAAMPDGDICFATYESQDFSGNWSTGIVLFNCMSIHVDYTGFGGSVVKMEASEELVEEVKELAEGLLIDECD